MTESSSDFIAPAEFSSEWRDISLVQQRKHTLVYTASRYGRRFLLKALAPDCAELTDYRLQQEQEFQLGVQLVHPNIAATYSLEQVDGVGRCIVQEWIDGVTLCEWIGCGTTALRQSRAARERVFLQLLDALEYLHGLQLVHHDLKADNILITRNGANIKLIDFGLSAVDSTLSSVPNDPRADIRSLGLLLPSLLPAHRLLARRCRAGRYSTVAAVRRALNRRKRLLQSLPVALSVILLAVAATLFYVSWHDKQTEQRQYEAMVAVINNYSAQQREDMLEIINRCEGYHVDNYDEMKAYSRAWQEFGDVVQRYNDIRDSVTATFDASELQREQLWQMWIHKQADLSNELTPQFTSKLQR